MRHFVLLLAVLLSGCTADSAVRPISESSDPSKATLKFLSLTDLRTWMPNATDIRFGIAISKDDITVVMPVVVPGDKDYNRPRIQQPRYRDYIVRGEIQKGEEATISIDPGIYDWLILVDQHNKNIWESYVGSTQHKIKMDRMEFRAGGIYQVVIDADAIPRMTIISPAKKDK